MQHHSNMRLVVTIHFNALLRHVAQSLPLFMFIPHYDVHTAALHASVHLGNTHQLWILTQLFVGKCCTVRSRGYKRITDCKKHRSTWTQTCSKRLKTTQSVSLHAPHKT